MAIVTVPVCGDRGDFYQEVPVSILRGQTVEFGTIGVSEGMTGDIGGCVLQLSVKGSDLLPNQPILPLYLNENGVANLIACLAAFLAAPHNDEDFTGE